MTSLLNFSGSPQALSIVREAVWKLLNRGQMSWHPQIDCNASPQPGSIFAEECVFTHNELCLQREDIFSQELVADEYLGEMPDEASKGLSQVRK